MIGRRYWLAGLFGAAAMAQQTERQTKEQREWLVRDSGPAEFKMGPRLYGLVFSPSRHNPSEVIFAACALWFGAKSTELRSGSFIVSNLDGYGRYHLRKLIASYEDPEA